MGKTSKTTFKRRKRSIWESDDGKKFEVRVVAAKGSQKRVKVTVDSLRDAELMVEAADEARKEAGPSRWPGPGSGASTAPRCVE